MAHGAEVGATNRFGRTAAEQAAVAAKGREGEGQGEGKEAGAPPPRLRAPPQRREKRVVISSGVVI